MREAVQWLCDVISGVFFTCALLPCKARAHLSRSLILLVPGMPVVKALQQPILSLLEKCAPPFGFVEICRKMRVFFSSRRCDRKGKARSGVKPVTNPNFLSQIGRRKEISAMRPESSGYQKKSKLILVVGIYFRKVLVKAKHERYTTRERAM